MTQSTTKNGIFENFISRPSVGRATMLQLPTTATKRSVALSAKFAELHGERALTES